MLVLLRRRRLRGAGTAAGKLSLCRLPWPQGWGRGVGVGEMFIAGERRGKHEQANGASWGQGQWDRLLQRKQDAKGQKTWDGWGSWHQRRPAQDRRRTAAVPPPQWQGAVLRWGPCQASIRRRY